MPFCTCMRLAGLLDDDALRAVDHFVGHFLAAMGGQAVHEERALLGVAHQRGVHLIGGELAPAGFLLALLAHARPNVGVDGHGVLDRFGRIGRDA